MRARLLFITLVLLVATGCPKKEEGAAPASAIQGETYEEGGEAPGTEPPPEPGGAPPVLPPPEVPDPMRTEQVAD